MEHNSANLNGVITNKAVIFSIILFALGLPIVEEVFGGPCFWTQTS